MRIGPVDTAATVAIVAELGNNHEGDMGCARELVRAAAEAGAHAVKLQAIDPPRLVRRSETARLAQLERFRLSREQHAELADLARSLGLGYLCTPFDLDTVDWLAPLVDALKIASADNDLVALIEHAAATGRPLVISTGLSDDATIERALAAAAAAPEVALLHCVSAYPTAPERAALASIPALAARHGVTVGYSDHTLGIEACVAAAAAGARILEKHLTLDHEQSDFRDHQLSAEPSELRALAARVAEVAVLLGTPRTGLIEGEEGVQEAARRSIVAARDLAAGHVVARGDLTWLRPRDGLAPGQEDRLVGGRLRHAVAASEPLRPDDVGS
jgi:N,N'-diacetyllegionaminate synthase